MKVSTKGRYGLRALVDMTANMEGEPVTLASVANRQHISLNYLEQVFQTLRKAGIVMSVKGSNGGYLLKKPAGEITVKEILEVLEGAFSITDRDSKGQQDSLQRAIQSLVWDEIDARVDALLEKRTLKQLVNEYRMSMEQKCNMYYI